MRTVAVVGGGPAGLAAAIHAAGSGARTILLERNDRCGVKLLATGGGHCNLANTLPADQWPERFGKRGRFIMPALGRLPLPALLSWFQAMGEPAVCTDGFHYFPASNSARAIRDALMREAARRGVEVATGRRASGLALDDGRVRALTLESGGEIACDAAVVACGGKSYPSTGSTWDGCRIAQSAGHRIAPPFPGLVGLKADNLDAELAGLVLPEARVALKSRGRAAILGKGELLLTHGGVSGPAILDLSATAAELLAGNPGATAGRAVTLHLRWLADADAGTWLMRMEEWRARSGSATMLSLLRSRMPKRLASWLLARCDLADEATAATLPAERRDRLALLLGDYPAAVVDTEGWDKAMITRGGVDVRDVDPATMASKLVPGLFFAGETLDIDGPCGGYNLHWAFASGVLAGESSGRYGNAYPKRFGFRTNVNPKPKARR